MEENQSEGRKVVCQTTVLAHWSQKVNGRLPALLNRLRRQFNLSEGFGGVKY